MRSSAPRLWAFIRSRARSSRYLRSRSQLTRCCQSTPTVPKFAMAPSRLPPVQRLDDLDDDREVFTTMARALHGRIEALGHVGQRQRGAGRAGRVLDEVQVLHEELELHLRRKVALDDEGAAD